MAFNSSLPLSDQIELAKRNLQIPSNDSSNEKKVMMDMLNIMEGQQRKITSLERSIELLTSQVKNMR